MIGILCNNEMADSGIIVIKRIKQIIRIKGQWKIRFVLREYNLVANFLVKLSLTWRLRLQVLDVAPIEVLDLLQQNKISGVFDQFTLM